MRYKIKGQEKEDRGYVELWLGRDTPKSHVELRGRHSSWAHHRWNHILRIYEDGRIELSQYVSEELGFKLDECKRVILREEI